MAKPERETGLPETALHARYGAARDGAPPERETGLPLGTARMGTAIVAFISFIASRTVEGVRAFSRPSSVIRGAHDGPPIAMPEALPIESAPATARTTRTTPTSSCSAAQWPFEERAVDSRVDGSRVIEWRARPIRPESLMTAGSAVSCTCLRACADAGALSSPSTPRARAWRESPNRR